MMRAGFYEKYVADQPRLATDTFFIDRNNQYTYEGIMKEAFAFVEKEQLLRPELWARFADQFRDDADFENGWRGEYWGKMMRGACFVYSATRNDQLYQCLAETVEDMLQKADETGRISSYGKSHEFNGWDIWCRKYVLLGMQYFLEICKDEERREKLIASMRGQMDYIMENIGDGKIPICAASNNWRGLNSCSILEPVVRLYSLTKEQRYLDFASYIVNIGGTSVANLFELAIQDGLYPYQYPITKAYEMMSCFEGLIEYYRVTGIEKYKTAVINFANKILESDFTVIGSSGCTHELFDHSTVRQANTTNGATAQETCVTVTLMKFLHQVLLLTGDSKYADAIETSLYNGYLGAFNTEKVIEPTIRKEYPDSHMEPLPFDSYSPLTSGTRGNGVGGLRLMRDNHYYGCCAAIGSAGIGLVPYMQMHTTHDGVALHLFIAGTIKGTTPEGKAFTLVTQTDYPKSGSIKIKLQMEESEHFEIKIRNPKWSKTTKITVNQTPVAASDGYVIIQRTWNSEDEIAIELDMRTQAIFPTPYGSDVLMNQVIWHENYIVPTFDREDPLAKHHIALRRGPLMLAQDARLGYSTDEPVEICVDESGFVDVHPCEDEVYPHIVAVNVPLKDGSFMPVTDYASAGKLWTEESKMAVWMLTK